MAPETMLWEADPHTLAKIQIVGEYLKAWFPILANSRDVTRMNYIDSFSGPGQYADGEKGSPIVALETALNHRHDMSDVQMNFIFIDKDPERNKHLKGIVATYTLPTHIKVFCLCGTFDGTLSSMMNVADNARKHLAPTFLFIDPFGISQTPFSVIERFMSNSKCEIMVNFMYQWVNRFKSELPKHLDELYGTSDWREVEDRCQTPVDREQFLLSVYERQLRTVARHVWSFRMLDKKNQTSYYLVYGTNHPKGLEKMKDAMWKISPTGDYSFSDRHAHQLYIFGPNPDLMPLRHDLLTRYRGQEVSIEDVEHYVITGTNYLRSHLKTKTLVPMERDGMIEVTTPRSRKFAYPPGTRIKFKE